MKAKPTGHGFSLPNDYGEAPMNLVFAGGDKSVDEMVARTERGVLVTRLWYIREVDPYEKVLTGMTRDGTFLVENGKSPAEFAISASIRAFSKCFRTSKCSAPPCAPPAKNPSRWSCPPMKVRNFHFSEVTKF